MTVLVLSNQENSTHLTVTDGFASPSACLAALGTWWNKKVTAYWLKKNLTGNTVNVATGKGRKKKKAKLGQSPESC